MGTGAGGNFGNTKGSRSNAKIHKGRQDKHIVGTNNYKQQIANGKHPSILTENPRALLKEGAGKGRMITPTKESVDFGRIIGKYYHEKTNGYYDTTRGTIHYDEKGDAHIVPARPKNFK
ncbi:polymorphic toxin type 50 domain-containing protein [Hydrogeniiclostridium mannosilyticum]|uniref:polymorphic toxin type 50 domain-containing protein n=1 Tax=Hydrogeniiclostridium mannosilyticum TaxID=2764322 RepID=UPI00399A8E16